jgi:tetratricopeptide (TPR) repeat protein
VSIGRFVSLLLALAMLTGAGCSRGKPRISALDRKTAANLVSEAEFAVQLRDYPRAADLYERAARLCPDDAAYDLGLGQCRRRLDQTAAARDAYEAALKLYRQAAEGGDTRMIVQEIYLLALLGKVDDARSLIEKAQKEHPTDRDIRAFAEGRQLDRIMADPKFKAIAL